MVSDCNLGFSCVENGRRDGGAKVTDVIASFYDMFQAEGVCMTEFDDFADEMARREQDRRRLERDTKPEWIVLQGFAQSLAQDGKGIEGCKFEWVSDLREPRLVLDCVAATFLSQEINGVPIKCRVVFDRRPAGDGKAWHLERSPLNRLTWSLKPVISDDAVMWSVVEGFEDGKPFSSFDFAQKIAIELAKFHLAYNARIENLTFDEMEELSGWKSVRDITRKL